MQFLPYIILICVFYFVEAKFLHLDYQYDEDAKAWLKLHKLKKSWHQARKICKMEGAILASPSDKSLKHALGDYAIAYGIDRFYVGLHTTFSSQLSVEGISLEKFADNLNVSQIESSDYESCAVMEAGSLISVECQQMFPYFCYKRDQNNCGTNDTECTPVFRKDYNYHAEADGWMKLHLVPATFHDAWLRCHLEGAILASPINEYIESAMQSEMQSELNLNNAVFTGVHATFSKGDFFSIEGVPLEELRVEWSPSEPNNQNNNEDCITYASNGTIADVSCDHLHPYICYKKKTENMHMTKCGTVNKEYIFEPTTGSCYKLHQIPRNWTRAYMTCGAEGGHLAIVNSVAEANALKEIYAKSSLNPQILELLGIMKDIIFIGFHDWGERGVWTTIHGSTLKEAGYDIWDNGQPNNVAPGQHCGAMYASGKLNDVWCDKEGFFICEKTDTLIRDAENPKK